MSMAMMTRSRRVVDEDGRVEISRKKLILSFLRYPIQAKTLLRYSVQVQQYLDEVIKWGLDTDDPLLVGQPSPDQMNKTPKILSTVPRYRAMGPTPRYYLTRYHSVLAPLFEPRLVQSLPAEPRAHELQRILNALDRFPILSPSVLQSALGPTTSTYFKPDLEYLVEHGTVIVWHPNFLEPTLADVTMRRIEENVTYRGSRYFLAEHRAVLKPFLRREVPERKTLQELLETPPATAAPPASS